MIDIRRILAPVDFSGESRNSLAHAAALARWYGAKIVVQHVAPPDEAMPLAGFGGTSELPPLPSGVTPGEGDEPVPPARELARRLEEFGAAANEAGLVESFCLDQGDPAREILARAERMGAELIALGTHGYGGFERFILGSVAERVLRKAPCPVVTVPPRAGEGASEGPLFKTILCPIDFGPTSASALVWAASLAQAAEAHLIVLNVLDKLPSDDPRALMHFRMPEYRSFLEIDAKERLDALLDEQIRGAVTAEPIFVAGKPHHEIMRIARERAVGLIVMGIETRGALQMALFGSTANQVIREAECPVLTVRKR